MSMHRITSFASAIVLLAIAGLALYRLLVGFPITIGNVEIGQTISFFAFVVCAALAVMLFRSGSSVAD